MQEKHNQLIVKGAREHNLVSLDVSIPRDQMVIITGVSGSGKSSLAFETIYAEGERRYLESLSTYARQFLGNMKKPDVQHIEGLSPAISIQQHGLHGNPRSIVATVTEIYDYMRLLWARLGTVTCPECGRELRASSVDEIVDSALAVALGKRVLILARKAQAQKGTFAELFSDLMAAGFVRARVDGALTEIAQTPALDKQKRHTIDVVIDRLKCTEDNRSRITESIELALREGEGVLRLLVLEEDSQETEHVFSERFFCPDHEVRIQDLEPNLFSFNAPAGACGVCDGLGELMEFVEDLVLDTDLSLREGAVKPNPPTQKTWVAEVEALGKKMGFSLDTPWKDLPHDAQQAILYGYEGELLTNYKTSVSDVERLRTGFEGVIPALNRRYRDTQSEDMREWMRGWMRVQPCPHCQGARLNPVALAVKLLGQSIVDVTRMNVREARQFFERLEQSFDENQRMVSERILREVFKRLGFILDVGLDYLTLFRKAGTLSGGEFQRIRLATQIGSGLMGVLYVLDEPTIGLHSRDTERLIASLQKLRDAGNTVLIVEHDEDVIRAADYIVDIGPGAGKHGGRLCAAGTYEAILKHPDSLTGAYLSGRKRIPIPESLREGNGHTLTLQGVTHHNLREVEVSFPLGKWIVVTGVSGSGKSSLINEVLYPLLAQKLYASQAAVGAYQGVSGLEHLDKVIDIDQSPIGRTPRSNPATYTGVFTMVRELFAGLPEAKQRGYGPGRFSFNVKGGRCEHCQGDGVIRVEMHFLPDVFLTCEVCKGARYNSETLQVKYKGKSIADVLAMTVDEAVDFFQNVPTLYRKLSVLSEVGLSYVALGQSATTLSGGEAQRVKIARELAKVGTGQTMYILDEPTVGLHFEDVRKLSLVLHRLVDKGNTIVMIEHQLDMIKQADHVIDLGPEGGVGGGTIVFSGEPRDLAACEASHTGRFLQAVYTV